MRPGGDDITTHDERDRRPTIGFLAPIVHGYVFGHVLDGLLETAEARGARVIAVQTLDAGHSVSPEDTDFRTRVGWHRFDALVATQQTVTDAYLAEFAATGKPLVTVYHRPAGLDCPVVVPDNAGGVRAAVEHLVAHGHRTIAFVAREPANADDGIRYRVYERAMRDCGLVPGAPVAVPWQQDEVYVGAVAAERLAAMTPAPTAVVAATDLTAIALIEALATRGVAVPGDVAVIGFDDIMDAATARPPLSTVAQDFRLTGSTAAALALDLLDGSPVAPGLHCTPVSFVQRQSCGCPPVATGTDPPPAAGTTPAEGHARVTRGNVQAHRHQYMISTDLVRRRGGGPQSLDWLAATEFPAGCLATWDEGRRRREAPAALRIVGSYDRGRRLEIRDEPCDVREFPPTALLDVLDDDPDGPAHLLLLPVRFDGSDWGFLALAGQLDAENAIAFERYNHWAVLLTLALDQEQARRAERKLLEEIRDSEQRYAMAAEAATDGLWDWKIATGRVYYSRRWKSLLGYADDEIGETMDEWLDRVHPADLPAVNEILARCLDGGEAADGQPTAELEYRLRTATGAYRWMLTRCRSMGDERGRVTRLVGSMTDITDRKHLEDRLRRDAHHDALTGLPNRVPFLDLLNQAIARTRSRPDHTFAVVFLDLDGFKAVNDQLGHDVGDEVLVQVAERLRRSLREGDVAARFGGDEFVLLLQDVPDRGDLSATVHRIMTTLTAPLSVQGRTVTIGASAGVAVSTSAFDGADEYLRSADAAMYHSKTRAGGSAVRFAGPRRHDPVPGPGTGFGVRSG